MVDAKRADIVAELRGLAATVPGFVAADVLTRLPDVPLRWSLVAMAAGAAVSVRLATSRPTGDAVRLGACLAAGAAPVLAFLAPRVSRSLDPSSPAHWGIFVTALLGGFACMVAIHRGRTVEPAVRAQGATRAEQLAVSALILALGLAVAAPLGSLATTQASIDAACRGEVHAHEELPDWARGLPVATAHPVGCPPLESMNRTGAP